MAFIAKRPCEEQTSGAGPATPDKSRVGMWVLVAAIVGSTMTFVDGSAVNVALPILERSLGATATQVQWVVESYALFLSALLLTGGALGDLYGERQVYAAGIAIFAVASAACGFAPNIETLIIARCVQGIGGAVATPGSLALISAHFEGGARGRAIGTWSGFSAISSALGPVLGGWLAQSFSWRAVFYINLPLAAFVLYVLLVVIPDSRAMSTRGRVDFTGSALATIGLGLIVYGLILWEDPTHPAYTLWIVLAGFLVFALFILAERFEKSPMVQLDLFKSRTFTVTNVYTFMLYGALGGTLYFLPFELIDVQGFAPAAAGAALMPFIVIMFVASRWSGGLVAKTGPRLPLTLGALIAGLGFFLFTLSGIGRGYWVGFFPPAVVLGIGGALFVAPLTTTVMDAVETSHAGVAAGINNAVSRTAGLLAIAIFGIMLATAFERPVAAALSAQTVTPDTRAAVANDRATLLAGRVPARISEARQKALVADAIRQGYHTGFQTVMDAAAVLCILSALIAALGLRRHAKPEA